jgi:O-antigen ligase
LQNTYYHKFIKYGFWALLFFTIWGTDLPFKNNAVDVEPETSSSFINQFLYSGLFIISVIAIIPRKSEFYKVIMKEKFLFIFILFSLTSMLWSDYSFVTFKRIFQILAIYISIICFLLYANSSEEILKPIKYILYPYLFLTIIVVFTVPQARQGPIMWQGFTTNKNTLGQLGFISVILCYIIYKNEKTQLNKILAIFFIFLSVVITVGSHSSTSLIVVLFLIGLGMLTSLDSLFAKIRIGKTISIITIGTFVIFILGVMILDPTLESSLPELFGKDTSFSGRTELWDYLLNIKQINPVLGSGYGAFWVPESERISGVYDIFLFLPGQAHNGYIDIFLATGYVGFIIMILILLNYFINYIRIKKPHPWVLFIIATVIVDFQESAILRYGHPVNFIFIFAYLILFVNESFSWKVNGN